MQRYFFFYDIWLKELPGLPLAKKCRMLNKIDTIIWDWNGTLLNDIEICIKSINVLLLKRGLSLLETDRYRQIFTFPVKDYYTAAGFDFEKEAFEIPAEEFIVEYNKLLEKANLFADVFTTLGYFKDMGIKQYIVSAMQQHALLKSVKSQGIFNFFEKISGIDNNLAHSKLKSGIELIESQNINPSKALLIGDTLHDHEVGSALGVKVVLISRGHQCHERLKINGNNTFADFSCMLKHFHSL